MSQNIKHVVAEFWYPKSIMELGRTLKTNYNPEVDESHPGFHDLAYRARRDEIAALCDRFAMGKPIPEVDYLPEENATWTAVYETVTKLHPTHACKAYRVQFGELERNGVFSKNFIPQLQTVSEYMKQCTGFQLMPVAGLLSSRDFLNSLAFGVFRSTQYVRHPSSPHHSPEPDCIHDLLGHVPMLCEPAFADFTREIGKISLGASDAEIDRLTTLYWFTVEFGLVRDGANVRAFGAGLLSSYGELQHSLSNDPEWRDFEPVVVALQAYQDQAYQPAYFVAESIDDMKRKMTKYVRRNTN